MAAQVAVEAQDASASGRNRQAKSNIVPGQSCKHSLELSAAANFGLPRRFLCQSILKQNLVLEAHRWIEEEGTEERRRDTVNHSTDRPPAVPRVGRRRWLYRLLKLSPGSLCCFVQPNLLGREMLVEKVAGHFQHSFSGHRLAMRRRTA